MPPKKEAGDDSQNETESRKKPVAKKYPFQTTQSGNSVINKRTEAENLKALNTKTQTAKTASSERLGQVLHSEHEKSDTIVKTVRHDSGRPGKAENIHNIPRRGAQQPSLQRTSGSSTETENKLEESPEIEGNTEERKKIHRRDLTEGEIDEICGPERKAAIHAKRIPGEDPRFQQQNQTLRCFVMYTDFYRCENILGKGEPACQWFKDVFTSICPLDWVSRWDEAREEDRLPWTKGNSQGKFPGDRYGV